MATVTDHLTRDDVLWALRRHIGADNGASAATLVQEIRGATSPGHERALRHQIEELRRDGHHICGHPSTGYFVARTEDELLRTCGYLHARAMTTLTQIAAMRRVSVPDLRGQLRLPTEHEASRGGAEIPARQSNEEGRAMHHAGESPERLATGGNVGAQQSRPVESRADQPAVSHNTGSASALPRETS